MNSSRALLLTFAIGTVVSISACSIARELAQRDPDRGPITRELAWDSAESLVVGVPADVRFVQAHGPGKIVVTGPRRSVETFSAVGGVLDDATWRTGKRLKITVTAPKVTRFSVKGHDTLVIENFDQDELRIATTGWADVRAAGRARTIRLELLGSGWANLSQLDTQSAEVSLTSLRSAIVAPRAWARISGQGDVILTTEPAEISQDPAGGGRVIRVRPPSAM